ncbi:MAG: DUF3782 domain-containing protein [Methylococcales bacterium]
MTDPELKELVASLAISQRETDRQLRQTDKQISELRKTQQDTGKQISELRQAQQQAQQDTSKQISELRQSQQETDRQLKETNRQLSKQLKQLGKQIGGLGEKFGGFTEGMAFPSMSKILTERFGMEVITTRVKAKKGGESLELDVLAYANSGRGEVCVVEVKSHLRDEGIEQLQKGLQNFRRFFPEHKDKKLYGILAVVDASDELRRKALAQGFYLAGIHDELFILETPENFVPQIW